jgi:two-component system response regulator AlgR
MPGMDGMALARELKERKTSPAVVFCTAYQDQALNAFEVEAVDYLVKPVRSERLESALDKARRYLGQDAAADPEHFLRSTVGGKVVLTPIGQVICLLAEDKYTTVIHEEGETVIDDSLTELEQRFPQLFFRVHRNALVAPGRVRELRKGADGQLALLMHGCDEPVEVSRRHASTVRRLLRGVD